MEVILLEKIDNLGSIGDRVNVRSGYGRNYLLPKGKATVATPENIAIFEQRRAEFEARQADELATAEARGGRIQALKLKLTAKAGSEGKLFGSVTSANIAELLAAKGYEIDRRKIALAEPLREVGEHKIPIRLAVELIAEVPLTIVAEA